MTGDNNSAGLAGNSALIGGNNKLRINKLGLANNGGYYAPTGFEYDYAQVPDVTTVTQAPVDANKLPTNVGGTTPPPKEVGWFDVGDGASTSKFGSTAAGVGSVIEGLAGLGSLYYQNKDYKLKKEAAELEKDKYARAVKADDRAVENRKAFANAVGGTYA